MRHMIFGRLSCLMVVVTVLFGSPQPRAKAFEPITTTAIVTFLVTWVLGETLSAGYDVVTGKPDLREMQREISALAGRSEAHAERLYALQSAVAKAATKEEVRAAFMKTIREMDARHGKLVQMIEANRLKSEESERRLGKRIDVVDDRVLKLGEDLGLTRSDLERITRRVAKLEQRIDQTNRDLKFLREDFDEFRRWNAREQAERLGVGGAYALNKGDCRQAQALLEQAVAYDPADPGAWYLLGVAFHQQGNSDVGGLMVAKGVAAERYKGPSQWFRNSLERVQGPPRRWLEARRFDPVTGARSSGIVRILDIQPADGGEPAVVGVGR
ncbi:tetratricopeptide repeat protein [Zavarzinella formosa]|uniref:tetratricopeptide repeat protein n=1 Tax=Zavarzinella formosa TaxID=360055 RepID=UPI0002E08028|nr:tetratricopeptide repeat protein [Zavarzinella formosa]